MRAPAGATVAREEPLEGILIALAARDHGSAVMQGYTHDKDRHIKRLHRVEGQIRGLARMIENDEYCIDVLTQVSAATKALRSVSLELLDEHLKHCVAQAVSEGGTDADEKVKEASDAIARLVRS
ncbi:DNA-binding transcriptional regulator, FrmR family [Haloechinothrix alba]|uniref:DNA-binding transcriptional regulator, FrmR family n=2 Tax=Haloechinothrix alba TaxID=664784 RepID=A0A238W5D0_9PSEU|nr:DNA-binding transcriptional regulator, FrmR family [Haloechinothrix alba]